MLVGIHFGGVGVLLPILLQAFPAMPIGNASQTANLGPYARDGITVSIHLADVVEMTNGSLQGAISRGIKRVIP